MPFLLLLPHRWGEAGVSVVRVDLSLGRLCFSCGQWTCPEVPSSPPQGSRCTGAVGRYISVLGWFGAAVGGLWFPASCGELEFSSVVVRPSEAAQWAFTVLCVSACACVCASTWAFSRAWLGISNPRWMKGAAGCLFCFPNYGHRLALWQAACS